MLPPGARAWHSNLKTEPKGPCPSPGPPGSKYETAALREVFWGWSAERIQPWAEMHESKPKRYLELTPC